MNDNYPARIRVFDNGGESWDRYTVAIFDEGELNVYGMSCNADAPNGFNQWLGTELNGVVIDAMAGDTSILGHEVDLLDLPLAVKRGIGYRLQHAF
jgi:hypothetical protein